MPPKKRKAFTASPTRQKRVRIGSSSIIEDDASVISASGRPKRSTAGEPKYDQTRHHSQTPTVVKQERKGNTKGGPDRPRQSPAPTPASSTPMKKRVGRPPKTATHVQIPAKKCGPPPSKQATSVLPKSSRTRSRPAQAVSMPPEDSAGAAVQESEWEDSEEEKEEIEDEDKDERQFWLMKAEPESRLEKGYDVKFSIDDLMAKKEPEGWDGVRNPVARNNMRAMREKDLAFFYHSNCSIPGIAGIMTIVREHSVDESAFDPNHPYYDPKSDRSKPKWELVHVKGSYKFENLITLKELKSHIGPGQALQNMQTLKQSRLSITPVTAKEWNFIMDLSGEKVDQDKVPE